jgi:hypothetical protein
MTLGCLLGFNMLNSFLPCKIIILITSVTFVVMAILPGNFLRIYGNVLHTF